MPAPVWCLALLQAEGAAKVMRTMLERLESLFKQHQQLHRKLLEQQQQPSQGRGGAGPAVDASEVTVVGLVTKRLDIFYLIDCLLQSSMKVDVRVCVVVVVVCR